MLTDKEREDFDYVEDIDNHKFFRYKNEIYDLNEFICVPLDVHEELTKWNACQSDTHFSGIVVKYVEDSETIIVGYYYIHNAI